jgi:hypothetical protein
MANRRNSNNNTPDILDAEWENVSPPGGQLAPIQAQPIALRPRNTARSNIQDGGYFDASGKRRPIGCIPVLQ